MGDGFLSGRSRWYSVMASYLFRSIPVVETAREDDCSAWVCNSLPGAGQRRLPLGVSTLVARKLEPVISSRQNLGRVCQVHVLGKQIAGQLQGAFQDLPV
tara:strand:+ start:162 stop:461 length:300 start_codon:yes stop_codon:yes gene_type:complete